LHLDSPGLILTNLQMFSQRPNEARSKKHKQFAVTNGVTH